jgi:S1-C subfamily serine protease
MQPVSRSPVGHRPLRQLVAGLLALAPAVAACAPPVDVDPGPPAAIVTTTVPAPPTSAAALDGPTTTRDTREDRAIALRVRNDRGVFELSTGSGFPVAPDTMVTNRHVVDGAERLEITTWDGRTITTRLGRVGVYEDLAIVTLDEPVQPVARLAETDADAGTAVRVVGYPGGQSLTVTEGEIVEYARSATGHSGLVMRLSNAIQPGNSGGPVLDETGAVVGVVYAIETTTGYALAIPVSALKQFLEDDARAP